MRTIFAYLFAFLGIILCTPYHLYLYLLAKKDQEKAYRHAQKLVKGFFGIVMFICGAKCTVIGLERVPKDQPILLSATTEASSIYCAVTTHWTGLWDLCPRTES